MTDNSVIVFDGVCVLCSRWVSFVLKRDSRREFRFAAMQTDAGRDLLVKHGIDATNPVTFLLVENATAFTDSDAALRIVRRFGFGWRLLAHTLRFVPRRLRDALYRSIARNRYRWFGRTESCYLPSRDEAWRFLA